MNSRPLLVLLMTLACTASEDRVDLEPLYRSVAVLCEGAECGDYSTSECKRYVFQDSVVPVFFADAEQECLDALTAWVDCTAAAGMCDDDGCPFPVMECTPADPIPSWPPPASVDDLVYDALAFQEGCGELYEPEMEEERREYIAAMTARLLGVRYDAGEACYDAFATLVRCEISSDCDADIETLCAGERATASEVCE